MAVNAKTDFRKVDRLVDKMMATGLNNIGNTIKNRAIILAPKDSGDLRQSAKSELNTTNDTVTVSFNTAYSKNRHYNNNLHPSTKYYLTNALKSISTPAKFFRRFF